LFQFKFFWLILNWNLKLSVKWIHLFKASFLMEPFICFIASYFYLYFSLPILGM
jgi:hypothetical protein